MLHRSNCLRAPIGAPVLARATHQEMAPIKVMIVMPYSVSAVTAKDCKAPLTNRLKRDSRKKGINPP